MTRRGSPGFVHAATTRVVAITAVLWLVLVPSPARADAVDQLIGQLQVRSEKVRLSAALNLTKLGDAKAIPALAKTLLNDSDAKTRAAAAVGLGRLVGARTPGSFKKLAISALKKAAANDDSNFVKAQAEKALDTLGEKVTGGGGTSGPVGRGGRVYVNVGPMSSKTGDRAADAKLRPVMGKTAQKTLARVASSMATSWAGGGTPTAKQLAQKGFQGFYVDGTINEVTVSTSGRSATVSCKISMLLASFPDKSVFGFLNGGAKVQGSSSDRDIALASEDCVVAVVEDLIAKKIVPTIKAKAGTP